MPPASALAGAWSAKPKILVQRTGPHGNLLTPALTQHYAGARDYILPQQLPVRHGAGNRKAAGIFRPAASIKSYPVYTISTAWART